MNKAQPPCVVDVFRRINQTAAALLMVLSLNAYGVGPTKDAPMTSIQQPATLQPGDTIMLIAPASAPREARVRRAAERLEAMGYQVILSDGFFERQGYLAGDDATRAAELQAAFANPDVDAVFPVTGGFGATRILSLIDFEAIADQPKIFIGFSDITALHIALQQKSNLATFHTPNPQWGLGSEDGMHPLADRFFWPALTQATGYTIDPAIDNPDAEVAPRTVTPGVAQGPIIGGNLAVLHALMGTPWEVQTAGKILFLEDVNESPYRVDRMLRTLKDAGKFDDVAGVLLGRFTKAEPDEDDGHTIDDVIDDYFADATFPVIAHFPAGHVSDNATLPFGVPAEMNADELTLRVIESPTVSR